MSTSQSNWQAFLKEVGRDAVTVGKWDEVTLKQAIEESSFKNARAVDKGDIIASWKDLQGTFSHYFSCLDSLL